MTLDGCEIRTGVYMKAAEAGLSERPVHQRVRVENWRDVRTGLARPLHVDERLYVCRMDSYDEVLYMHRLLFCLFSLALKQREHLVPHRLVITQIVT